MDAVWYKPIMAGLGPIIRGYHRLEVLGAENVPPGGCILAPNHTNWFGWDAMVVSAALPEREIRWASWSYEDEMPSWDAAVRTMGGILFNKKKPFPFEQVASDILKPGGIVGIFPEGNNNTVKQWYRLRPFLPGCVRLSVRSGAPIVPVAVAGIEEAAPIFSAREHEKEPISHLVALPFPLPTKAVVHFGEPVSPRLDAAALGDREALFREAARIQRDVLMLLREHRPRAWAEDAQGVAVTFEDEARGE